MPTHGVFRVTVELLLLVVVGSAIWVLVDAPTRGLSAWWAAGTLFLWIVVFPIYLVQRGQAPPTPRARPPAPAVPQGRWEPDPRNPERLERWREGSTWTQQIRPRKPS